MKITKITQQVKRKDRYSIYVDDAYAFSLSESALLDQGLATGQEFDKTRLEELRKASGADKAFGNALRYVAMRPRSEWELQTYLKRKEVEEPVAKYITERLRGVGLLDDLAFARAWVDNRRLLKSMSKRKLRLELQQKHINEHIADQVLAEDETDERQSIRDVVAKKQHRYPDRMKLMQYLARQGFGYDDIKCVLDEQNEN